MLALKNVYNVQNPQLHERIWILQIALLQIISSKDNCLAAKRANFLMLRVVAHHKPYFGTLTS